MTGTLTERTRDGAAPPDAAQLIEHARAVIRKEAAAVAALEDRIDDTFVDAVERIASSTGRVIVSGIGKSGIVGRKIAATLSSTGTPSLWMHSAEAAHGDLGQLTKADVLSIFSEIKACTAYKLSDGTITDRIPYDICNEEIEPVYDVIKGWNRSLSDITEEGKFPKELSYYISYLEEKLQTPVSVVSLGPNRSQTIVRA